MDQPPPDPGTAARGEIVPQEGAGAANEAGHGSGAQLESALAAVVAAMDKEADASSAKDASDVRRSHLEMRFPKTYPKNDLNPTPR